MVTRLAQPGQHRHCILLLGRHSDHKCQPRPLPRRTREFHELVDEFDGHIVDDEPAEILEHIGGLGATRAGQPRNEEDVGHGWTLLRQCERLRDAFGDVGGQPRQLRKLCTRCRLHSGDTTELVEQPLPTLRTESFYSVEIARRHPS